MRTTGSFFIGGGGEYSAPRGHGGPSRRGLFLLGFLPHEAFHEQEHDGRDDDEVDESADEVADRELDVSYLEDGLAPVPLRCERADDRHDEIRDERAHKLADRGADHDGHGQPDDVVLLQERIELAEHELTLLRNTRESSARRAERPVDPAFVRTLTRC